MNSIPNHRGYSSGHPWYFLLGGPIQTPKQIRSEVIAGDYFGYRNGEFEKAAAKHEPKRSRDLRRLRDEIKLELKKDISRYRALACQIRKDRTDNPLTERPTSCDDVHIAIALKRNHIFNGFAHLNGLDRIPVQQADLFDLV